MSAVSERLSRVPSRAWMVLAFAVALVLPQLLAGTNDDFLDALIQTLAYTIMALGLNIVVGFAGLLDLGYVAFYAIGAFVIGWFGSQQFADVNGGKGFHLRTEAVCGISNPEIPGLPIIFFIVIF
ncbi:MAG TPA: hypothetical protein PKB03_06580, partial [Baekduia sp.]|nr:hypothetical protein [Baekduia sp.]